MFISAVQGMRDELAARLGEVESDNTDRYTTWFNISFRDIQNTFPDAPFLQTSADRTLSSGIRFYSSILPTDFRRMNSLTYPAGDIKLAYLTPEEFDTIKPSANEGGNPTIYTLRGMGASASMEVYPVPGSAITVHMDYEADIGTVSASSAVPRLPGTYLELPIIYGEIQGYKRKEQFDEAAEATQRYNAMKNQIRLELERQVNESNRIKSVREFQRSNRAFDDPIKNLFHSSL